MELDITLEQAYERCDYRMKRLLEYSVDLVRKAESLALKYHQDGFYLAMSFGKDSQALYHVAQLAGVKFTAHFSPTSVDPPELIRFGRTHYPEVKFEKIEKSIYQIFKEKKILPSMVVRWCCKELKEFRGAGRVTLTGVRNAESAKRASRREVEVTGRKFSGDLDGFNDWRKTQIEKKNRKVKQITPPRIRYAV